MHGSPDDPAMGKQWRLRRRPGKPSERSRRTSSKLALAMQPGMGNGNLEIQAAGADGLRGRLSAEAPRNRPDRAGRTSHGCLHELWLELREQTREDSRVSTYGARAVPQTRSLCEFPTVCGVRVELAPIHRKISLSLLPSANCFFRASALMPANSRTR